MECLVCRCALLRFFSAVPAPPPPRGPRRRQGRPSRGWSSLLPGNRSPVCASSCGRCSRGTRRACSAWKTRRNPLRWRWPPPTPPGGMPCVPRRPGSGASPYGARGWSRCTFRSSPWRVRGSFPRPPSRRMRAPRSSSPTRPGNLSPGPGSPPPPPDSRPAGSSRRIGGRRRRWDAPTAGAPSPWNAGTARRWR